MASTVAIARLSSPANRAVCQATLLYPAHQARSLLHSAGQDVHGAVAQQRHAARLAGHAPPSLFECAELLCTQAAAADVAGEESDGPADSVQAPSSRQLAELVGLLPRSDVEELRRLVGLLRGMQQVVGREPLPQAVRRVLHESGLAAWVQRQQAAAALADEGSDEASQNAAGQGGGEQLPPRLRSVVLKAQQLAEEWQQQGSQVAVPGSDSWSGWLEGGSQGNGEEAASTLQQQQGVELVRELLVRLAPEITVDSAADVAGAGSCAQQQCGADPGAFTISTIHAAKGLEWEVVLLPSVCDGHLPVPYRPSALQQAAGAAGGCGGGQPPDHGAAARAHYEEERRLFHVAATRARDLLLVSYVQPVPAGEAAGEGCQLSGALGGVLGGLKRRERGCMLRCSTAPTTSEPARLTHPCHPCKPIAACPAWPPWRSFCALQTGSPRRALQHRSSRSSSREGGARIPASCRAAPQFWPPRCAACTASGPTQTALS